MYIPSSNLQSTMPTQITWGTLADVFIFNFLSNGEHFGDLLAIKYGLIILGMFSDRIEKEATIYIKYMVVLFESYRILKPELFKWIKLLFHIFTYWAEKRFINIKYPVTSVVCDMRHTGFYENIK